MKRIFYLVCVFTVACLCHLHAQNRARDEEPKVLFGGEKINISGFGGIILEFSSVEGHAAIMNGGGGAVLFNRSLFLGGYGLSLSNSVHKDAMGIRRETSFTHGGFYAGYVFFPHKLIHFGVSNKLGWGVLRLTPEDAFLSSAAPISDNVFVWVPQLDAEMNFSHWFKVNAGVGYRTVTAVNNSFYDNKDFSSPSFTLSFLFGWFK
ncbi:MULTISPECIES: hypothetical protein [unclassified Imperialibacter]|uniref:hypothetical protein n=1 Tax=unclassified Imperialibacter TaxID=2629706 RepID=UPI001259C7DA|nr:MULTISPECIES: hypothetical protein [unclassified Imperialibacter]CAD5269540.1 conserved exported hypothetical protein [Imperialibacter sp. 89]CAD5297658.1 conserved exported hypothetical protein [Imperialibacter sp. 75]VVT34163.1 conserved exported hypothetical protein [Imperialibacter sp. EC-SDR9]